MQTTRLTALRLTKIDSLLVKELHSPVTFKLNIVDPLTKAQLGYLVQANPWRPSTVEAHIGEWNQALASFDATITQIEMPPRNPAKPHKKVLRWGQVKRKRGFMSHD